MIQGSYNCTAISGITTPTCQLINGNLMNITRVFDNTNLSANQTVSFSIGGVRNPISTASQTGIVLTFYGPDGGMVDQG